MAEPAKVGAHCGCRRADVPPLRGLHITFSLQERFSEGFAASLAWTMPYSRVFGVAKPRQSRARFSPSPVQHDPGYHSSPASPSPTLSWGSLVLLSGRGGSGGRRGVLPGAGGWHCGPAAPPRALTSDPGCQPWSTQGPHADRPDTGSAGVEGPQQVPGPAGFWPWVPAPNDSTRPPESTQGVR